MNVTYEKFSTSSMKVRILYIKKLLNTLNYNLIETPIADKQYKKALKKFQETNNFGGNCIVNKDVFNVFISKVDNHNDIWKTLMKEGK